MNGKKNIDLKRKNESDFTHLAELFFCFAGGSVVFGLIIIKLLKVDFAKLGVYGDFLGGATVPFLTVASILYVLKSVNMQKDQLEIQKIELEDTKKALEEQSKTSRLQRFENTFFILTDEIRKDIQNLNSGIKYFKKIHDDIRTKLDFELTTQDFKKKVVQLDRKNFEEEYLILYSKELLRCYDEVVKANENMVFI
ncbi:hypothetical protein [Bacillus sp. AFS096315]|uniref:hypothetical protein n=1 Tax=Bacillus sp. AFS096315 TaxID=2033517 RepID=UPI000BEC5D07|nr:hypothetical protein [Bacillus sp. AFS096315]PEC50298.1 hypothetical protein CON00_07040 [Bacillus sp. AFS096315]